MLLLLAILGAARAAVIDTVFYDNRFGTIDEATGAYTQIGVLPIGKAAGIASLNGSTYAEDLANNLFLVDPVTGSAKLMGNSGLNLDFVVFAGGAAGLFGIDYQSNLYAFNPQNGTATLIGPTGLAANNGHDDTSLSFTGTSLLYTAGPPGRNDELYRIDPATGIATDLGSTGVTAIAGSAFSNGSLDLFQYGQSTNYIWSAADGSTSFVRGVSLSAQIVDGGVPAESAGDSASAVAEPGSVIMAASALAALAFGLWRRDSARRATA